MTVSVAIDHPRPADISVRLQHVGGREFILVRRPTSVGPAYMRTFTVDGFLGDDVSGTWRLVIVDSVASNVGTLQRWSMDVTTR
jgi:subtilisin-like proprotein convertase family protein